MNYVVLESMFVLEEPAEMTATLEELYDQSATLEAFADDLESDLLVAAFEAVDSDDSSADEASAISAKFRSGYRKIEEGKKKNNKSMVTAGQREVDEASRELQAAEKNAKTAEQKRRLKKVAKIAIAVAGAVALAVLAYVGIKNRDKLAGAIRKLKRNNGESVASAVSDVKQITNAVASAPTESTPQAPTTKEAPTQQTAAVASTSTPNNSKVQAPPTPPANISTSSNSKVQVTSTSPASTSTTSDAPTSSTKKESTPLLLPPHVKEKTERQLKADRVRADRAHKKEMKNWAIFHREYPEVSREDYDKMREDASDMGAHYIEEKRLMREFRKTEKENPEKPNYSLRNEANRELEKGHKIRDNTRKLYYARNPIYGSRDKVTHGTFSGTYSPERYHGADDQRKYDVMLNDIYQKYSIHDKSEGNEKRHKLIFRTLKSDVEKFKGFSEDKISRMSDNELHSKLSTLRRIDDLIGEYKERNSFGAKDELKWYKDDLDRPIHLMLAELKRRD